MEDDIILISIDGQTFEARIQALWRDGRRIPRGEFDIETKLLINQHHALHLKNRFDELSK